MFALADPLLWVEIVVGNPLPQVWIPVRNETGGTLTLRLTGPATYDFTLGADGVVEFRKDFG